MYDDNGQILDNPFLKSWRYVPQYFLAPAWKHLLPLGRGNYYWPLFLLWTRVNYLMFGSRPLGWHAMAVLLHLLVTGLVYLVVREMTKRPVLAWLTALIFGVHPIHHEVVAWVSGSTESLFAAFFLGAFLLYLRSRKQHRRFRMLVSCGLYGLALLSKETAIVLPILVLVHSWIAGEGEAPDLISGHAGWLRRSFALIAVYVPFTLIYLALRYNALSGFSHPIADVPASIWLFTVPSILFFYVK